MVSHMVTFSIPMFATITFPIHRDPISCFYDLSPLNAGENSYRHIFQCNPDHRCRHGGQATTLRG